MGYIIIVLVLIGIYFLFKEMKKDFKKELEHIKNENSNLE